jgi:steroid delta-isomerase-like uncharacterized protein
LRVAGNGVGVRGLARETLERLWRADASSLALSDEIRACWPPGPELRGPAALAEGSARLAAAFPDAAVRVEDVVVGDSSAVVRVVTAGEHLGEFYGLRPTGRQATLKQVALLRFREGAVDELRLEFDLMGLFEQLGVLPPIESAPGAALSVLAGISRVRRRIRLHGEAALTTPAVHRPAATANIALVHSVLERVFNERELGAANELLAPDVVVDHPANREVTHGVEKFKELPAKLLEGFPDLRVTVEHAVAEGDRVGARWIIRGTHDGTYRGVPRTGNSVRIPVQEIVRIRNGQICEMRFGINLLGVAQQLGVMPSVAFLARVDRLRPRRRHG